MYHELGGAQHEDKGHFCYFPLKPRFRSGGWRSGAGVGQVWGSAAECHVKAMNVEVELEKFIRQTSHGVWV